MNRFTYTHAQGIDDAIEACRQAAGATFNAGGTNFDQMLD